MDAKGKRAKLVWLNPVLTLGVAVVALMGVVWLQRARLNQSNLGVADAKQAEQQEAWQLRLMKQAPTFGFDNLVADWTFLNFLQYYGDTPAREQTGYSLSPAYFDIITRLDPRFVDIYLFLSGSISYQLGKPDQAAQLMDRGTRALSPQINPRSYLVWRFKGLDHLLLLGDIPAAIHSYEMAAQWAAQSPDFAVAPLYRETANFLKQDPNSVPARFQAWSMVYYQAVAAKDKQTQERAKREILALGGQMQTKNGRVEFVPPRSQPKKAKPSS